MTRIGSAFLFLCFLACQNEDAFDAPDISHIDFQPTIIRFEQDLFGLDTGDINNALTTLETNYPHFSELYFRQIVPLHHENRDSFDSRVLDFITNDHITSLVDTVGQVFGDFKEIEMEIQTASRYFLYYFPDFTFPRLYTLISEFGYQTFIFSDGDADGIGIGLDMYLTPMINYKALDPGNPAFSDYLTRSYNVDHVTKNTFSLIADEVLGPAPGKRLLDRMVHEGKKLYFLAKILPATPDSVLIDYSQAQLNWAKMNEREMWAFFLSEKLIYETNHIKINKYLEPAPTSSGMPPAAPGRTAVYMGWQIVKAYMNRYPDVPLSELIAEKDSQKILESARYKPPRK